MAGLGLTQVSRPRPTGGHPSQGQQQWSEPSGCYRASQAAGHQPAPQTVASKRGADEHSIEDGCIEAGVHRLLRFDFLSHNVGDSDLVVGAPGPDGPHPDWFVESASHGHWHLKNFNEFRLLDLNGNEVTHGYKQAFCLVDIEHLSPWGPAQQQFTDCNRNQGVSAGWADLYEKKLSCQFIVLDGVPDGDYLLRSTTNAQRLIPEDTFVDNTTYTRLRIVGDTVTVLDSALRLVDISGYGSDGQGRYAAFWEQSPGCPWEARTGIPADAFQRVFDELS
ncbi:lysyl oxidase family protein [Streptomyces sp. NPDC037389]|uniref:lysyl oxidase family protein n=1 Tax=Streptomyces sp. NPDC037389 TaxID=3155369 RepID=UPI00340C7ECC